MNDMSKNFIMITPAKNEEKFLPHVINSVVNGSYAPVLWLIIDDGSSDSTLSILQAYCDKYKFIRYISLNDSSGKERDLIFHYSVICRDGFKEAIDLAKLENIEWDYIGLLDADTIVTKEYFDKLLDRMEKNKKIGLASGNIHLCLDGKIKLVRVLKDVPSGTGRVWRKESFIETDGYIVSQAPDAVSMAKIKIKNWETARFSDYVAYQLRHTSSASGLWKGYEIRGKATYYLNCHPLLVIGRGLTYAFQLKFYLILPFLIGYLESWRNNDPKSDDSDVIKYYGCRRFNELIKNAIGLK